MTRGLRTRILSLVGLVLLAACGGGGGEIFDPPPRPLEPVGTARLAGRLLFSESGGEGAPILEAEPNDSPDTAHRLGEIRAGDVIVVHGHTTAEAGADPFDGFEIYAPERVEVTATLEFPDELTNDFDMRVYDLVSMQFVEGFLAVTAPEVGVFVAKGSFDLVVNAWAGAGDYVLTISAAAPATPIPEREPNDAGAVAQYLGEIAVGEIVNLSGTADQGGDRTDGFLISCPDACTVASALTFPAGMDFDVRVYDATDDPTAPVLLAAYESLTSNPEVGEITVAGGTLLYFEGIAFTGGGAWTLTLEGNAAILSASKMRGETRGLPPLHKEAMGAKRRADLPAYGRPLREMVAGEVLVGFAESATGDSTARIAKRGGRLEERPGSPFQRVRLDVPVAFDEVDRMRYTVSRAAALRSTPGVRYAEPNYICRAHAEPDDTHYNLQWHYELMHLPEAWNLTVGSSSVIVAVIDTGEREHPDLVGRLGGGYDFISSATNAGDGDGQDSDPTDPGDESNPDGTSSFHGTHVAGTIGAATDNGQGVAGVTWLSVIMHLRALGRQGGTISDIADAVRYAARLSNGTGALPSQRAHIINMSLGGAGYTQTMQDAIDAARGQGVVIFASAGNEASSFPSYPAAHQGVISISAVDMNGNLAPYSNYGTTIDLAAPGGDLSVDRDGDNYPDGVLSTLYDDSVSPADPIYAFYQGTSMAAPHAAGVAALMLAVDPTLTPDQLETILRNTADDRGDLGRDDAYGHGLIDAHAAVLATLGTATDTPVLLLSPTSLNFGTTQSNLTSTVTNGGGGFLTVTNLDVSTQSGDPWLSAASIGPGDPGRNVLGIGVTVDRAGLTAGGYSGRVEVESSGGNQTLQVLMTVGSTAPVTPDAPIYVLAIDAATYETVEEIVLSPGGGSDFVFPELPPGVYVLAAGTDLDDDGLICDEGEWCGMYPVASEPVPMVLSDGDDRSGIEFLVAPADAIPARAGEAPCPTCTFRRLR